MRKQNIKEKPRVKSSHFYHVLTLSPDIVHKTLKVTSYSCLLKGRVQCSQHWRPQRTCREPVCFGVRAAQATTASVQWYCVVALVAHTWRRLRDILIPPEKRLEVLFLDWPSDLRPTQIPKWIQFIFVDKEIIITDSVHVWRVFPSGSPYLWSCDAAAWMETSDQQAGPWGWKRADSSSSALTQPRCSPWRTRLEDDINRGEHQRNH